jgi:hypothetical protein
VASCGGTRTLAGLNRRAEQNGDGQARSRFELIDFPDSKLYSPIEDALPDRAAMPLRYAKRIYSADASMDS